jgi:hypothetical protein
MPKLIVVVGLPGAGKSPYLKELSEKLDCRIIEDFMKDSIGDSPGSTRSKHYPEIVRSLRGGTAYAIADVAFCDTGRRVELQAVFAADVAGLLIDWHFFANNSNACRKNVTRRSREELSDELRKIDELSGRYFIPEGVTPIPVVD